MSLWWPEVEVGGRRPLVGVISVMLQRGSTDKCADNLGYSVKLSRWLEKSREKAGFTKHIERSLKIPGELWVSHDLWTVFAASHCLPSPHFSLAQSFWWYIWKIRPPAVLFPKSGCLFFHPFKIQTSKCKTWTLNLCNRSNIFSKAKYKKQLSVCRGVERTSAYGIHLYYWQ